MIDDLLNPASLPDPTEHVSLIQTHISLVFVADNFVYKVKKPVNFGFLDFTTLEKRKHYCFQEVRLNQRLAQDIYLGVLPIIHDGGGYHIGEGEGGDVVDYTVKMKKIPQHTLMKSLFNRDELREEHLREIAHVLADFHRNAERSPEIDKFGEPEAFRVNTDENFEQTERYKGTTIEEADFYALRDWTDRFYMENGGLFRERIREGKIRDCHGDLHMEHICLTDKLSIIDCIEFNDRFRYSDILADIAFLLMDLEYQGGKGFADQLWEFYGQQAGEAGMEPLLAFYKVYRAYVRGKVTSFRLDDDQIGPREKEAAAQTAVRYFQLARSYI
ncbi:MAG: phosphotransferase [Deltaproteobacteria bacterium]|nr:phosphotransferase [Deltaproteobacteria bacterium]